MSDGMEQRWTPGMTEPPTTHPEDAMDVDLRGDGAASTSRPRNGAAPMPSAHGVVPPWGRPSLDPAGGGRQAADLSGQLLKAVAEEILPRLRQAHSRPPSAPPATAARGIASGEITRLTSLSMSEQGGAASAYVEAIHRQGTRLDTLCFGLLAPAAEELGARWDRDECSFVDVTLGLVRLQQALTGACRREQPPQPELPRRRALLLPARGEQHTFGLSMVAAFFRRDGWEVVESLALSERELGACVNRQWFDAVGFSVGSERNLDKLATDIRGARAASTNGVTVFLVGGPVFLEHPELAPQVGADGTAGSAREAPLQARHLTGLAQGRK